VIDKRVLTFVCSVSYFFNYILFGFIKAIASIQQDIRSNIIMPHVKFLFIQIE